MSDRRVTVEDGKYTVVFPDSEGLHSTYEPPYMLRHGEPWEAHGTPNNVEVALAHRVIDLEDLLNEIEGWLVCDTICTPEDMAQQFRPYAEKIAKVLGHV